MAGKDITPKTTRRTTDEAALTRLDDLADDQDYSDTDLLTRASIPPVSWPEIGTKVSGTILSVNRGIQTDVDGNVRTFSDGTPRPQIILIIQTDEHDDEDDDGERRVFFSGAMMQEARRVMKRLKAPGFRRGGEVTITYREDGEKTSKALNPPKLFDIDYTPPF